MKRKGYVFSMKVLSHSLIFFLGLAGVGLLLVGCGAHSYEKPPATAVNLSQNQIVSERIKASGSWRQSGVAVEKGKRYLISATGKWRIGGWPHDWSGADGLGSSQYILGTVKGYSDAALIARVGNDKPFFVGASYELTAPSSGALYFRINEGSLLGDNQGFMDVKIQAVMDKKENLHTQSETFSTADRPVSTATKIIEDGSTMKRNWAVIIGISKYQHSGQSGLTNLIFADDDAKAFARVLGDLGWTESHIRLLVNEEATQRNIMIALESWLTKAGPNDQIVLFWAGHGFPDPEDPEKVYFACYDTDISIPATGYRMDKVRDALEERRPRNVVLLADTCHAGKLITRGVRGISIVPEIDKMHREQDVPKGWIFMVGAETDRQAIEHSSWSNGAFTHCLLNALSGGADGYLSSGAKDGIVTMGELRVYLNNVMPDETQRVLGTAKRPLVTTSTGDPDIWNLTLQAK